MSAGVLLDFDDWFSFLFEFKEDACFAAFLFSLNSVVP